LGNDPVTVEKHRSMFKCWHFKMNANLAVGLSIVIAISTGGISEKVNARESGRSFIQRCTHVSNVPPGSGAKTFDSDAGYCIGFIQGLSDGSTYTTEAQRILTRNDQVRPLFCIPNEVSKGEIAKGIYVYGQNHPELLDGPELGLMTRALRELYPCK